MWKKPLAPLNHTCNSFTLPQRDMCAPHRIKKKKNLLISVAICPVKLSISSFIHIIVDKDGNHISGRLSTRIL